MEGSTIATDNITRLDVNEKTLALFYEISSQLTNVSISIEMEMLPPLPLVETLYCKYINLYELPELPNVRMLNCRNNQLTELPELPKATHIYCNGNQLTRLPKLPIIEILHCVNNDIREIQMFLKCVRIVCDDYLEYDE